MSHSLPSPGIITSITAQQKSNDRVNISIDDAFAFGLHADLVISENLSNGVELSREQIDYLLEEDAYMKAREKAFRLISYRPRATEEIKRRLAESGFKPSSIDRVTVRLVELEMLDDQKFASEFVKARIRNKGFGPSRIRNDLRRKGVPEAMIETAIKDAYEDKAADQLAATSAEKIFERLSRLDDVLLRRKKLSEYLARRGFSFDQMNLAFESLDQYVKNRQD